VPGHAEEEEEEEQEEWEEEEEDVPGHADCRSLSLPLGALSRL